MNRRAPRSPATLDLSNTDALIRLLGRRVINHAPKPSLLSQSLPSRRVREEIIKEMNMNISAGNKSHEENRKGTESNGNKA